LEVLLSQQEVFYAVQYCFSVLFLMLLGAIPTWPHSRNWGYYPSGGLGLVLLIILLLMFTGRM